MAPPPRNLVNLQAAGKEYASRRILDGVTLGVAAGDRIGIVGRNGDGKSTLLRLIAGREQPDGGQVTRQNGLRSAVVDQQDPLDPTATIRQELIGQRAEHEWAGDPRFRDVLDGLLGGVTLSRFAQGLDTVIGGLSGGERRRIALAQALTLELDLLLLDEPTNHLDVEGVDWLARHLAARRSALAVITHDRWFLDAVCTHTWEVTDGDVHQYEGGYAAYVLARAERDRQAAAADARRRQLLRKELAWLRRGPPARTSKPKFRIDAANELIADEPPARDGVELLRFASARLGNTVLEAEDVVVRRGERTVLRGVTWRLGPGDRVALVGVNGAGKSTLVRTLAGEIEPESGTVERGSTVRLGMLSQDTIEVRGDLMVIEALEEVRGVATTSEGEELTAGSLADRFGFRGAKGRTLVRDLSGGERRRLQLMRVMLAEPNVLLLDEPTNDLDIDTLTALEDLLDRWPGTLVIVSHDRYVVERVCDDVYGLAEDGSIRHLPGGIEQYVAERREALEQAPRAGAPRASGDGERPRGAVVRAARKEVARLERQIEKLGARAEELQEEMTAAVSDHVRLRELQAELADLVAEREQAEADWLEQSELLEDA